jgi:predicted O-methyltransferase YrrM
VDTLVGRDDALEAAVAAQRAADMPAIEVAPTGGKLLWLLARLSGARRVLEVGTLGGYSTIWLARGIPDDGRVVTIEAEPRHAEVARASIDRAGVGSASTSASGAAPTCCRRWRRALRPRLHRRRQGVEHRLPGLGGASGAARHSRRRRQRRPGGRVADAEDPSPQVRGVRAGLEMLRDDPRFTATALQTLDAKGWDGIALALVV